MRYCIHDGCRNLLEPGRYYCDEHRKKRKSKGKKRNAFQSVNKSFYRSDAWQSMRQFIYERDKGKCTKCNKFVFGKSAHVHHIEPISKSPELKLEETNLTLLCNKCHAEEENKMSKAPPSIFEKYFG